MSSPEPQTLADQTDAHIEHTIFEFAPMPGDRFGESEFARRVAVEQSKLEVRHITLDMLHRARHKG